MDKASTPYRRFSWLRLLAPLVVLCGGVLVSLMDYRDARRVSQQAQLKQFGDISNSLIEEFDNRIAAKKYLLLGVRGLFGGSFTVQRDEFNHYMKSVNMQRRFPATQAVIWFRKLYPDQVETFVAEARRDARSNPYDLPAFRIHPQSESSEFHVAAFIEPLEGNEEALGYDLSSDPEIARALRRARDTGEFVATRLSTLSGLGIDENGFMMLLPIYGVQNPETLNERRSKYIGSVVGVFRIEPFLDNALLNQLDSMQVYDVGISAGITGPGLYNRFSASTLRDPIYTLGEIQANSVTIHRSTSLGGRQWVFQFSLGEDRFNKLVSEKAAWQIAGLGILLSIISSLFVWSLVTSRDRALRKARQLTDELVTANKNLERSNKDLTQFAFVASHDLQTPVRNLEISITLLEDTLGDGLDDKAREFLHYMHDSTQRMQRLVADLLTFARVDKESVTLVETDLRALAGRVVKRLNNYVQENGAQLSIGELPVVLGDQDQLERLIMNLITNAVKYRHPERTIKIDISSRLDNGQWLISVADNGMGIDEKYHEKVFESFQRLHRHDEIAGTGLGLGICRQIMAGHNGSIYIERSDETGTVFTFSLPYYEALARAA